MKSPKLSSGHAFLLGLMAMMVAVLCVSVRVVQENMEARVIMAGIWILIAIWWLVLSYQSRKEKRTRDPQHEE